MMHSQHVGGEKKLSDLHADCFLFPWQPIVNGYNKATYVSMSIYLD